MRSECAVDGAACCLPEEGQTFVLIGIIRSVPKTVIATLVIVARHREAVRQVRVCDPETEKQAHVRAIATQRGSVRTLPSVRM